MIFWQKYNKIRRLKSKVIKISYLGIYDQNRRPGHELNDVWFRMWVMTKKRCYDILYNGNIYMAFDNNDKNYGLTMAHKRCFDLIIAKTCQN